MRRRVRRGDAVVGIAASGVTPFVRAALAEAGKGGAFTALITCNPGAPRRSARVVIALRVGPEVLAGSTRLKAGTATKLALNTITTATFTRLGKVYGNRMSGRPGRVKAFYAITIPRPRDVIKVKDSEEPRRLPRDLAHPGRRVRVRRPA